MAGASFSIEAGSGPQSPPGLVWQSAALKTHAVICGGTRTAPFSTSKANGQAGTSTSYRSSPSGRPALVAVIGFSPTMSTMHCWPESETLSPARRSLSTCRVAPAPESCKSPERPLSKSGRPSMLVGSGAAVPAASAGLILSAAEPAFFGFEVDAGARAGAGGLRRAGPVARRRSSNPERGRRREGKGANSSRKCRGAEAKGKGVLSAVRRPPKPQEICGFRALRPERHEPIYGRTGGFGAKNAPYGLQSG